LKYNILPEEIQKAIFNFNKNDKSERNRFLLGLVVNRLLLALKNKRIKVTSLDKTREHYNRNLLECLVLDSKPSLYSMYLNLRHYIKFATSYEWNMDTKSYHDPKRLPTQNQLNYNLNSYILSRKEFINHSGLLMRNRELEYDSEFKIIKQYDIGETFKTGSYDRYVVFRNFPDSEWVCTIYKMGLIQISANPFKAKTNNIHLGNITKELFEKYRNILSNFRISIGSIKKINESESYKLKQKYSGFESIGFRFNDLVTFYKDDIYYLPNRKSGDMKTSAKLNILDETNEDVIFLKSTMDKLYSSWTFDERQEMSLFKITGLSILETGSGGHPSITNIQGLNYLDERRDAIQKYFGMVTIPVVCDNGSVIHKYIQTFEDLMVFFTSEYLEILKTKLSNKNEEIYDSSIELNGITSELV
jgi:hypothetical protein